MYFLTWLSVAIALAVCEVFTAGFFIVFFAIGAGITAILSLFFFGWIPQLVMFLVFSIILLFLARPTLIKTSGQANRSARVSNVSTLPGEKVLILESVNRYGGRVKVLHTGEVWTAYLAENLDYDVINREEEALVVMVDGAKLVIQKQVY